MAKALQSQLNAQDFQEASLWFGMTAHHFRESNFDSYIHPIASKALDQMQQTGIPLDYSSVESEISKSLSGRVGWNVEDKIHPLFASDFNEDTRRIQSISSNGLSTLLLTVSKDLSKLSSIAPSMLWTQRRQPYIQHVSSNIATHRSQLQASYGTPILPPTVCQTITQGSEITGGAAAIIGIVCADLGPLAVFTFPQLCTAGLALGAASGLLLLIHGFACY